MQNTGTKYCIWLVNILIFLMLFTKRGKKFDPNVNMSDTAGTAKFFKKQHQWNIQSDALSTSGAFFQINELHI